MAKQTFICPITIDNSGTVAVNCTVAGAPAPKKLKVKAGDTLIWLQGDQNVQAFTLKFYEGETKSKACAAPPFDGVTGSPTNTPYYSGQINKNCTKTISYSVDATKLDGSTGHLDPIIIIENYKSSLQVFAEPLVWLSLAVVATLAYFLGRRRSG